MGSRTKAASMLKSLVAASPSSLVVPYTDLSSTGSDQSLSALLQHREKDTSSMACKDAERDVQQLLELNKAGSGSQVLIVRLDGASVLADEKCIGLVSQHVSQATKGSYVGLLSYDAS